MICNTVLFPLSIRKLRLDILFNKFRQQSVFNRIRLTILTITFKIIFFTHNIFIYNFFSQNWRTWITRSCEDSLLWQIVALRPSFLNLMICHLNF